MSRPHDWQQVLEIADPTPGDPLVVQDVSRRWSDVADEAERAEGRLRGLLADGAVTTWVGKAGDQFRKGSHDLPDQLAKVARSYRLASDAMGWWAGRLSIHQDDADRALARGREARADLDRARGRLAADDDAVQVAGQAIPLAALAPTPDQVQAATDRLRAAEQAQASSRRLVEDAEGRLDLARRLALDAQQAREGDARETEHRVREAAEAGVKPRSFWQKLLDALKAIWKMIVKIAKIIVAVLSAIAMVLSGPLFVLFVVAAVVVVADAIITYASGETSLFDFLSTLRDVFLGRGGLLKQVLGRYGGAAKAAGAAPAKDAGTTSRAVTKSGRESRPPVRYDPINTVKHRPSTRPAGIGPVQQGAAGVSYAKAQIQAAGGRVLGEEISVRPQGHAAHVRPDLFASRPNGTLVFYDVKTGKGAGLTHNQRTGYPAIATGPFAVHGPNGSAALSAAGLSAWPSRMDVEVLRVRYPIPAGAPTPLVGPARPLGSKYNGLPVIGYRG